MPIITHAPTQVRHEQILTISLGFWQKRALAAAGETKPADLRVTERRTQ
ncbi:MAG TPA: hypothetical protein VK604_16365 [Bryobacteraceae bacterium]|nr:hypothetical protein [Bryobacteraceae bacterium]